jgi:hypothetical protein
MTASKSGYYESSRSSSEADRVRYDPRREQRNQAQRPSNNKRPVVIIQQERPTNISGPDSRNNSVVSNAG